MRGMQQVIYTVRTMIVNSEGTYSVASKFTVVSTKNPKRFRLVLAYSPKQSLIRRDKNHPIPERRSSKECAFKNQIRQTVKIVTTYPTLCFACSSS